MFSLVALSGFFPKGAIKRHALNVTIDISNNISIKMCGILALLGDLILNEDVLRNLETLINCRGPDYQSAIVNHEMKCGIRIRTKASVLHLRGALMQKQPVIDEFKNVLLFNGHIYEFSGYPIDAESSDTKFLMDTLSKCVTKDEVAHTFSLIDGPFAFVYWHETLNALFYGRDLLGRRSLNILTGVSTYPTVISSVAVQDIGFEKSFEGWVEVGCQGFYCIDFTNPETPSKSRYMWDIRSVYPDTMNCLSFPQDLNTEYISLQSIPLSPLNFDIRAPTEITATERSLALKGLEEMLRQAIAKRLKSNVSTCLTCRRKEFTTAKKECSDSKVAVGFSGGVDSALIALILDKIYDRRETIDLINVAFKSNSPDRSTAGSAFKELCFLCPERHWRLVLCDIDIDVLQDKRHDVIRHLISPCNTVVDDSLGCACWFVGQAKGRALSSRIEDLDEIFDRFLAYDTKPSAITSESILQDYISPATMLFIGSGIDEQLGGYSSHRAAWSSANTQGLLEHIAFQMLRLPTRNLGRDDRIFSHHARDVKLPYLDYKFVSFLNSIPVGLKMNLDESLETGPKKLLRELAYNLGLKESSRRVKKAMQFGTKIAHLENPREKGNELCARLS